MPIVHAWSQAFAKQKTLVRGLNNFAIGGAAFTLTCMALHAVLPLPDIEEVSDKLRFFAAHQDEFDTLFIGSSRTYHQVSPSIFDQVMRENGTPTRSFNFGIDGMRFPESIYLLERILDNNPPNLKWVVIELDELHVNWVSQGEGSRRALYWHDWKRTSLVLRRLLGAGTRAVWLPRAKDVLEAIFRRKMRQIVVFHLSQFQKDFTNLGRARDARDYFMHRGEAISLRWLGRDADGYRPMKTKMPPDKVCDFEETLAHALKKIGPQPVSVYTDKAARQCAERIRKIGAIPVFLVQPTPKVQSEMTFRSNSPGMVMSFNNALIYPSLYQPDLQLNISHLNKTGAEELTQLMALKFAELLREGKIQ